MLDRSLKRHAPTADDAPLSDDAARALVADTTWYHRFALRPGLMSGGQEDFHPKEALDALGVPEDLTGKKALDVGAWDGPATFELERRGAEAYALDIQDPAQVGFATARRVMGSRAVYYQGSVYALPQDELTDFDHIIFRGVYYHLKHPILGFECLSAALKPGGILHFEGEAFLHYAETLDNVPVPGVKPYPRRPWSRDPVSVSWLKEIAESEVPVCLSYPNWYKDGTNWFIPNPAALKGWLRAAGLEIGEMRPWTDEGKGQRLYGWARKVGPSAIEEHPLVADGRLQFEVRTPPPRTP